MDLFVLVGILSDGKAKVAPLDRGRPRTGAFKRSGAAHKVPESA
jgi:hypothetical protein